MQMVRFLSDGVVYTGRRDGESAARVIEGELCGEFRVSEVRRRIDKLLAPIVPVNILCIGLNYREHAQESGAAIPTTPVLFIKANSALNNPGDDIVLPFNSDRVDYEGELAIVIGRKARNVSREEALSYILGYTIANDVSARDWQRDAAKSGGQWCRAKSFDGFCPLGPWIVTVDEIPDPNRLAIRTLLNGRVMQDSNTGDMIFDIPTLIQNLSSTMTLYPGTVILTGTPPGVGFARTPAVYMMAGDRIRIEIEKIGALENRMVGEGEGRA